MKLKHSLTHHIEINSKWFEDLTVRSGNTKLQEKNIDIGGSNFFFRSVSTGEGNQSKKLSYKKGNHQQNNKATTEWEETGDSDSKESACNAGDSDLIPRSGWSPGGGHGTPLQYSCLENSMDRGAWWATFHRVTKRQTWLSDQHNKDKYSKYMKNSYNPKAKTNKQINQFKKWTEDLNRHFSEEDMLMGTDTWKDALHH